MYSLLAPPPLLINAQQLGVYMFIWPVPLFCVCGRRRTPQHYHGSLPRPFASHLHLHPHSSFHLSPPPFTQVRHFAFCTFKKAEEAARAIDELNGEVFMGKKVRRERRDKKRREVGTRSGGVLCVFVVYV